MNVAAYDRREERRIAKQLVTPSVPSAGTPAVRSSAPSMQGITPTALRKKVHRLGPTASLIRIGKVHYIATIGRHRFEGYLGEVNQLLQPLFNRFNIS